MHDMHADIALLRRFMRTLYREMPAMRGELQMVAITQDGPILIHPDKKSARAYALKSQKFFQSPEMAPLWTRTLADCVELKTSMYSPFFDAFFINVMPGQQNGGFDLDWVVRHELGHALDELDMKAYAKNIQLFEMTADAFATLHMLRENPDNIKKIEEVLRRRSKIYGRRIRGNFNTAAAIKNAVIIAKTNDITHMPLTVMAAVARDTAQKTCPKPKDRKR